MDNTTLERQCTCCWKSYINEISW